MSGYQPFETLRPIVVSGPPVMPVVNRALVRPETERERLIRQAVEMRQDRVSTYEIARRLKVSRNFVCWNTRHIPEPEEGWQDGRRTTRFNREKAARMHRAGFSYAEIGEDLGCSASNVWGLLNGYPKGGKHGVQRFTRRYELIMERTTGIPSAKLRRHDNISGRSHRGDAAQTKARAILYWLIRRHQNRSLPVIGRALGGFDHTSILWGCRRVDDVIAHLNLIVDPRPGRAARQLWRADWPASALSRGARC